MFVCEELEAQYMRDNPSKLRLRDHHAVGVGGQFVQWPVFLAQKSNLLDIKQ